MPTLINCPNCASELNVESMLSADAEEKIKRQYEQLLQQSQAQLQGEAKKLAAEREAFEEKKKKENELFFQKLAQEKQKLEAQLEADRAKFKLDVKQDLQRTIAADYETQLRFYKEADREKDEKLKQAQQQQVAFMRREKELQAKERELELELEKKLLQEKAKLQEEIRNEEVQRNLQKEKEHLFREKDLEMQLEEQKRLIEEMKRKAEQGSMQRQGEVQELLLEELLRNAFPFDSVSEVGKGVRGADCIQTIRNNFGQDCGTIIYESKRTQAFSADWIEKLKRDMRQTGSDIAVIVTNVMPKDMDCFGLRDGVWVCCFSEVKALAAVLRDGVIRVFNTAKSSENRSDKVNLLYSYLTSNEFSEQWKAIREGFMSMKLSIQAERNAMEKLWKAREKQLEKVLLSAAQVKGSIEGIAGQHTIDFDLEDDTEAGEEKIHKLSFK